MTSIDALLEAAKYLEQFEHRNGASSSSVSASSSPSSSSVYEQWPASLNSPTPPPPRPPSSSSSSQHQYNGNGNSSTLAKMSVVSPLISPPRSSHLSTTNGNGIGISLSSLPQQTTAIPLQIGAPQTSSNGKFTTAFSSVPQLLPDSSGGIHLGNGNILHLQQQPSVVSSSSASNAPPSNGQQQHPFSTLIRLNGNGSLENVTEDRFLSGPNGGSPLVLFSQPNFGTGQQLMGPGATQINLIPNGPLITSEADSLSQMKAVDFIQANSTLLSGKLGTSSGTTAPIPLPGKPINNPPQIILSPRKQPQIQQDFVMKTIPSRTSPSPGPVGNGLGLAKGNNSTTILPVAAMPILEETTLTPIPKFVPGGASVVPSPGTSPYQIATVNQMEATGGVSTSSSIAKSEGLLGLTQTFNLSTSSNSSNFLNGNATGLLIATGNSSPGSVSDTGLTSMDPHQHSLYQILNQKTGSASATGSGRRRTTSTNSNGGNLRSPSLMRAGTREVHNKLEKNRRAQLRVCFNDLKKQLPKVPEEKKTSNLSILSGAIRYINSLKRKEKEAEHEVERLAKEKISLQNKVASLKRELPPHLDIELTIPPPSSVRESSELPLGDLQDNSSMDSFPPTSHHEMSTETPPTSLVSFANGFAMTRSPTSMSAEDSQPRTSSPCLIKIPSTVMIPAAGPPLGNTNTSMQFIADSMPVVTKPSPVSIPIGSGGKHKDSPHQMLPSTTTILAVPNFGSSAHHSELALKLPLGLNLSASAAPAPSSIPLAAINLSTGQPSGASAPTTLNLSNGKSEILTYGKNGLIAPNLSTASVQPQMFLPQPMQKVVTTTTGPGRSQTTLIGRDFAPADKFIKGKFNNEPVSTTTTILDQPSTKVIKLMNGNVALATSQPSTINSTSIPSSLAGGGTTTVQIFEAAPHQPIGTQTVTQQCLLPIYSSGQNGSLRVIGHQTTTPEHAAKIHQQLSSGMVISSTPSPAISQFNAANGAQLHKLLISGMSLPSQSPLVSQSLTTLAIPSAELTAVTGGQFTNILPNGSSPSRQGKVNRPIPSIVTSLSQPLGTTTLAHGSNFGIVTSTPIMVSQPKQMMTGVPIVGTSTMNNRGAINSIVVSSSQMPISQPPVAVNKGKGGTSSVGGLRKSSANGGTKMTKKKLAAAAAAQAAQESLKSSLEHPGNGSINLVTSSATSTTSK